MSETTAIDRTSPRQPPSGWPVMYQTWDELLFLHWPVPAERLRPLVPAGLEIDTWEGTGWVGVTPFTMYGIRPVLVPPLPLVSSSHELNVRTYVHRGGVPGVWFLSLDASNPLAVWGARVGYCLPYFRASMRMEADGGGEVEFRSVRAGGRGEFHARWRPGPRLPEAAPGTRDFFLIERYCLYSENDGRLYRARIHHRPWPLCAATVERLSSNVLSADGLPEPEGPPLVHAQAEPLRVRVWPPKRVG